MPLYEYRCEACEHRFEVIRKYSDGPIAVCPSCGQGPIEKLLSSPAIQFKGTGWYITDYARKGQSGGPANPGASTTKSEGGSEPAGAKAAADGGAAKAESTTESRPAESSTKK
jgi:putative FmdB family regulatory protein